jgi:hypothetical protein
MAPSHAFGGLMLSLIKRLVPQKFEGQIIVAYQGACPADAADAATKQVQSTEWIWV